VAGLDINALVGTVDLNVLIFPSCQCSGAPSAKGIALCHSDALTASADNCKENAAWFPSRLPPDRGGSKYQFYCTEGFFQNLEDLLPHGKLCRVQIDFLERDDVHLVRFESVAEFAKFRQLIRKGKCIDVGRPNT
jgi:hypothetical protein